MSNKHVTAEMRSNGVSSFALDRAEVNNAFITELPMTVTGKVTRRVPSQQAAEEALLRRNLG